MELEWMRSLMTLAALITFIGIVAWAWSARKRADFDAAASSVLFENDGEMPQQRSMTNHASKEQRQ